MRSVRTRSRLVVLAGLGALVLAVGACAACGGNDKNTSATPKASATNESSPTPSAGDIEACPPDGAATALTGAGAAFPGPLYADWFARYKELCGVDIDYRAIGSDESIAQITLGTVDFAASDVIMSDTQKAAADPIYHIPMTSDVVAVIYNIDGLSSLDLTLDGATLAGIFLGTITRWNDPAIAALNGGVTLPDADIAVVHRSDDNPTTLMFTNYLGKVSTDWLSTVGSGTSVEWPAGTAVEGNSGVAGQIAQVPNSISYVSLVYARQNDIGYARLKNKSGTVVEPSAGSAQAAQEGVIIPDDAEVVLTDSSNADAYPITGFTWLLLYAQQTDKAKAQALGHLIHWMLTAAQQYAEPLDYVPLSDEAKEVALAELDVTSFEETPILDLN